MFLRMGSVLFSSAKLPAFHWLPWELCSEKEKEVYAMIQSTCPHQFERFALTSIIEIMMNIILDLKRGLPACECSRMN